MKTILSKRSEKKEGGFLSSYFDKFASHPEAAARGILLKKMFLKMLQIPQENTCVGVCKFV